MSIIEVLNNGLSLGKHRGDLAKILWKNESSIQRWLALRGKLAQRRLMIRAAHLRSLRRVGLPLHSVR
jgi:hypothetical protein